MSCGILCKITFAEIIMIYDAYPADRRYIDITTQCRIDVGRRLRRWLNINPTINILRLQRIYASRVVKGSCKSSRHANHLVSLFTFYIWATLSLN